MKFNSKISGIILALLAVAMLISAASAVNLANEFNGGNFKIGVLSGTNFDETVNISTSDMDLAIFENSANNSGDMDSIIYFKDSTANKSQITSFIKDLESDGTKVEETGGYVVLKNTQNSKDFDIANGLEGIFNFAGSFFSSDGLNVSSGGDSISLSKNGLEIYDADGENVYITSEGVSVSGSASSGNETVKVSSDVDSNIGDCDYSVYLKNQDNDKVIVISGNDLELLKAMAKTVSFNEN